MAKTTDSSTIFRIVAIVAALLLVGAAALTFLQGGSGAGPAETQMQRLETQAQTVLAGKNDLDALSTSASGVSDGVTALRTVANALMGEETDLDLRALDNNAREVAREPLGMALSDVEAAVEQLGESAAKIDSLASAQQALAQNAASIGASGSEGPLPAFLQNAFIPIGMIFEINQGWKCD